MCFKSVIKRVAPFLLTFSVGLFIASFFVTVAAPNFSINRRGRLHKQYDAQREMRISELERENNCLRKRQAEMEKQRDWVLESDLDVPPPPPPVAPTMPMKTVPSRAR